MQAIATDRRIASCLLALAVQAGALAPAGLQAAEALPQAGSAPLLAAPQASEAATLRRLLVKFKSGASGIDAPLPARTAQLAISDLSQRLPSGQPGRPAVQLVLQRPISAQLHVVLTDRGLSPSEMQQLIGQLLRDPLVEYAEIDSRIKPQLIPNDPLYDSRPRRPAGGAAPVFAGARLDAALCQRRRHHGEVGDAARTGGDGPD